MDVIFVEEINLVLLERLGPCYRLEDLGTSLSAKRSRFRGSPEGPDGPATLSRNGKVVLT